MNQPTPEQPRRSAPVEGPYLKLEFPYYFRIDTLERSGWMEWGAWYEESVYPQPDGSYVLASAGSPFYIRCVADYGDHFVHVDGGGRGELFQYRIVELDTDEDPDGDIITDLGL